VQGDSRSYRAVLALDRPPSERDVQSTAPELTNRIAEINRVVALCGSKSALGDMRLFEASISKSRLDLLREADAIVREATLRSGFDERIWQMPVVLIPVGSSDARESVVLRPINSLDGMTADVVLMNAGALNELTERLLRLSPIAAVFYDLTHKPPGTIEWE
jgi:GMP synthase (glutamine-hydrolysing)